MGNKVYATVGSDDRARAVEALGAEKGINYKTQDFVKEVMDATSGRGVDVILDDRDARPGVMFAEWELIGAPLRVTVGERGLNDGVVELQARRESEAAKIPVESALETVLAKLDTL
ncbi:hypothetical protein G6F59_017068 [Rhizopus arrhizus]|nr:hypothetical protein G6F59_017068 [Rhizopus arrhizus]